MKIKEKRQDIKKVISKRQIIIPVIYLAVITIFSCIICSMNDKAITYTLPIVILMSIFTGAIIYLNIKSSKEKIENISLGFEKSFGKSIKRLTAPVLYINKTGKLIWENSSSSDIDAKEYITEILIMISKQVKKDQEIVNISGKPYNILYTNMMAESEDGILVILIDKTEEAELARLLDNTRPAVGCVTIDSYEDMLQGLEEIDKFTTTSTIDKAIVEWITNLGGIVSKVEKDRYIYAINKANAKELEHGSYEILEKISKISENVVKVPVTISIGTSYDEDTLSARYKSAMSALDIAMGRGGNQAVVKTSKKFDIYANSSKQLDKTNKVRARTISQALKDVIEKSENVYIMGHKNTDIDCIGASVGICKIAKTLNKEAKIIIDIKNNGSSKSVIERLKQEESYEDSFVTKEDVKKLDFENSLLVIVDTHKESYLAAPEILEKFDKVVLIDHHRRGPEFIENTILTYHEVYASSTSELVTELLMYLDEVKLTPKEAETIFSGIVIDTKNFTFKTGVRTFEVAAYLKKTGLDITEVKHMFQNDFETYMTRVNIVKSAEIIDGQIAISTCNTKNESIPVIAAQAADELLSITGILASFVLCEIDEIIMISGRSLGDINVQIILEKLGGGGHLTFAGAQLAGVTLDEAKEKLLEVIKEYHNKPE